MKRKRNSPLSVLVLVVLLLGATATLSAQITLPGDGAVDDEPAMPIDGMLGLGIAAGLYYGVRKVRGPK